MVFWHLQPFYARDFMLYTIVNECMFYIIEIDTWVHEEVLKVFQSVYIMHGGTPTISAWFEYSREYMYPL